MHTGTRVPMHARGMRIRGQPCEAKWEMCCNAPRHFQHTFYLFVYLVPIAGLCERGQLHGLTQAHLYACICTHV